jgi:hypothetical protein
MAVTLRRRPRGERAPSDVHRGAPSQSPAPGTFTAARFGTFTAVGFGTFKAVLRNVHRAVRFLLLSAEKASSQKILEEKHAMRVQILRQEKSFQDLLRADATCERWSDDGGGGG